MRKRSQGDAGLSGLKKIFNKYGSGTIESFMEQLNLTFSQYSSDPEEKDDTTYLIADVRQISL